MRAAPTSGGAAGRVPLSGRLADPPVSPARDRIRLGPDGRPRAAAQRRDRARDRVGQRRRQGQRLLRSAGPARVAGGRSDARAEGDGGLGARRVTRRAMPSTARPATDWQPADHRGAAAVLTVDHGVPREFGVLAAALADRRRSVALCHRAVGRRRALARRAARRSRARRRPAALAARIRGALPSHQRRRAGRQGRRAGRARAASAGRCQRLLRADREGGAARPLSAPLPGRADVLDGARRRRRSHRVAAQRRRRARTRSGRRRARTVPGRRRQAC